MGKASGDVREMVKRHLEETVASGGLSSGGSVFKKLSSERKFWLVVNCELIVYGATEPDATVTMQGKPLKLRPELRACRRLQLVDADDAARIGWGHVEAPV